MKRILVSVGVGAGMFLASSAALAAVEYVRICDAYGTGYEYVPGTDTCRQRVTGETRVETEGGTWRSLTPYPDGKWTTNPALECGLGRHVPLGTFVASDFTPNAWSRAQTVAIAVPTAPGEIVSKVTMGGGFYNPRIPNRVGVNGQEGLCVRPLDPNFRIPVDGTRVPLTVADVLPVACVANSKIMGMPAAYTVPAQTSYPQIVSFRYDERGTVFGPLTFGTQLVVTTDFGRDFQLLRYFSPQAQTYKQLAGRVTVSVCIEKGINQTFVSPR